MFKVLKKHNFIISKLNHCKNELGSCLFIVKKKCNNFKSLIKGESL